MGDFLSELPDDLIEDSLAWLPLEYLCKFRSVCMKWNALFSSTEFVRRKWIKAPPNKKPWLLVCHSQYRRPCSAYFPFTRSWKSSFPNFSFPFNYMCHLGSDTGLFLFSSNNFDNYVCNPLTGKSIKLPVCPIDVTPNGPRGIVQEGENNYKVVMVGNYIIHDNPVSLYDSTFKDWRMVGRLPRDLVLKEKLYGGWDMVFGEDCFYCLTFKNPERSIMRFNIKDHTILYVAFPEDIENDDYNNARLVKCGSRILLVSRPRLQGPITIWELTMNTVPDSNHIARMSAMWEFNHTNSFQLYWHYTVRRFPMWQYTLTQRARISAMQEFTRDTVPKLYQIAMMPPTIYDAFEIPPSQWIECAGMGDCLYFKKSDGNQMVVYSFTQNSWTLLPSSPTATGMEAHDDTLFVFQPKLDMKVD